MKKKIVFSIFIILFGTVLIAASESGKYKITSIVFKGKVINLKNIGEFDRIFFNGKEITTDTLTIDKTGDIELKIIKDNREIKYNIYSINGLLTILPPLLAIIIALIFKDVVIALFIGIFSGAIFIYRFDFITAFFRVIDKYVLEAIADKDRASIIIFTLLLGGMVGIITKTGGVKGVIDSLSKKINSVKSTQMFTWLMGIMIFFDDYTNTLLVGNTMRPLSDKWRISREKLSYIVDSTAAPMASIAIISTWIGFEISLINQSLKVYNVNADAYSLFLSSLPFYPHLHFSSFILR